MKAKKPKAHGDGWVRCEERMPENDRRVRICDAYQQWWCVACWDSEVEEWFDIETDYQNDRRRYAPGEVTHWQDLGPLPAPPEVP